MSSSINCCMCFYSYNKDLRIPMVLNCGHTFCKYCLDRYIISKSNIIPCPTCKIPTSSLKRNYGMISMLEDIYPEVYKKSDEEIDQKEITQRKIVKLWHLNVLKHSVSCSECTLEICVKMKKFLSHKKIPCIIENCKSCKCINNMILTHSRTCNLENCLVPDCKNSRTNIVTSETNVVTSETNISENTVDTI